MTFTHGNHRTGWLILLAASAVGGWFFGKGLLKSGQPSGDTPNARVISQHRVGKQFSPGSPQGSWMAAVKKATPAEFPRLFEEWKVAFSEGDNYLEGRPENALRWLFAAWLAKDPEAFIARVSQPNFSYSQWGAEVMVRMMPEKTAELIFGPTHGELNGFFVGEAATELAKHRPALYLKMNPDGTVNLRPGMGNDDWEIAISALAKTDARAAGNACLRWKVENDPTSITSALLAVAAAWKTGDPPMNEWVDGITDPVLRALANHARLCVLAENDPRAALAELVSPKFEQGRDVDTPGEILKQLAKKDPVGALKLLKDLEGDFLKYKRDDPFAEVFAETSAEKPANPFYQLSPKGYGEEWKVEENGARNAILGEAAGKLPDDPIELFAALQKLTSEAAAGDGAWQRSVEASLIRLKGETLSAADCLTMVRLWSEKLNGGSDDTTFQTLAARVAQVNPELALASLDQLPESARPLFAGEIILQSPPSDSARNISLFPHLTAGQWDETMGKILGGNAASYAEAIASLPATTTLGARTSFVLTWGDHDPEAAAQWLESMPDDALANGAAKRLTAAWAEYDEFAASAWAATLRAGPTRDAVAVGLAFSIARENPDDAWQWANSISDSAVRKQALVNLDERWGYDAPEKFRAALDEARLAAGLPERGEEPPPAPPDPNDPFR